MADLPLLRLHNLRARSDHVCSFLRQAEISRLSLARKSFYQLVRPILYRHPNITTYTSLTRFQRTITQATYMGKVDFQWSSRDCLDQTRTLDLTIDPTTDTAKDVSPPPAIMISRIIKAIVRRCPNLEISLCFEHCHCSLTPISMLGQEIFPRVTKLIIYIGSQEPDGSYTVELHTQSRRRRPSCWPNAQFWRPFVNGECFPDCKNLEIRHYWAAKPPANASLISNTGNLGGRDYPFAYSHTRDRITDKDISIGNTRGLKKLETILLESTPELSSPLLMQLLGNPDSVATHLETLDLRYCDLDEETISNLLYHAPPNLKHLVLICHTRPAGNYTSGQHMDPHSIYQNHGETPHLCPLIRDLAKRLVHLEFAAPTICRELFFDDIERQSLRKNGIRTRMGNHYGLIEAPEQLDTALIRETVEACRKDKKIKYRNDRVNEAVTACKFKSGSTSISSSLFGGSATTNSATTRAQSETELILDGEEESRQRLIEGSKTRWFRRYIAWRSLCDQNDTWAEMQLGAEMEEKGIEWVLASECWFPLSSSPSKADNFIRHDPPRCKSAFEWKAVKRPRPGSGSGGELRL